MGRRWTKCELAQLRKLRNEGLSHAAIARKLRRTKSAIDSKLNKLQLVDERRSKIRRKAVTFDREQQAAFCDFIRNSIAVAPASILAEVWNSWARRRGWPLANVDRVRYWADKLKLTLPPEEAKEKYRSVRCRRARRRGPKVEAAWDKHALKRRGELKKLRDELLAENSTLDCRPCPDCRENWPLREPFYACIKGCLRLTRCRECQGDRQRYHQRLKRRGVSKVALKQRQKADFRTALDAKSATERENARRERDVQLEQNPKLRCRTCVLCKEVWPLDRRYFYPGKKAGSFRKTCRFCDNEHKKQINRCRADGSDESSLRRERLVVRQRITAEKHRAQRQALIDEMDKLRNNCIRIPADWRECPRCGLPQPLTEKYWHFRNRADNGKARVLDRSECRYCVREIRAASRLKLR